MKRFAAIDVGSNGIRCLIVESAPGESPRVIESVRESVRLGSRVFHTGSIGEPAGEAAVGAFRLFRRLIDSFGVELVRAVATSAVREAKDGPTLVERIRKESGIEIRIIDGSEEAHLVRRAVATRLDLSRGRTLMVDVGGGSVEVLGLLNGDIVRTESFALGAVRLLHALPGLSGEGDVFKLLDEYVDSIRARVLTSMGREPVALYAATGGSIETLGDLAGEPAPSPPAIGEGVRTISLPLLRQWVLDLASLSYRQRIERYGLREDRADVIVPAAMVYVKMGEVFGMDRIYVPNVGLKDGLVLDMIDELERRGDMDSRRREVRSAAFGLGGRYALDAPHAERVTDLSISLFDQLKDLHGLGDEARPLLEAAGILHDVGIYVSASKHHKHSYYLISESGLVGLDNRQREIVANVARYHRRAHPSRKHPPFAALPDEDQELVRKLAAILRVADVLDREHRQLVTGVRARRKRGRIELVAEADGELLLERWAAGEKFALFRDVFGLDIVIGERKSGRREQP